MLSEDVRHVNVSLNGSQHCLAKGAPNRNPEHEHKRSAPNQQDAGNNLAMPTAKFETSKFCHWFRGPDSRNRVPASQIETRKEKWSTHLIVNLRKVKMISFQGAWHPRPANSSIPAYAQTPVDVRPTLRWRGLDSNHQFRESRQRCPHCGLQGRGGGASATVLAPRMVERSPERLFERRRPSRGSSLRVLGLVGVSPVSLR